MDARMVLASHNLKKTAELRAILEPLGVTLLNLSDFAGAPEPAEDGGTFEANAAIKAVSALEFTGLPAVADDSGLMVDALGGRPGVHSARFAGEKAGDAANNALLLDMLAGKPERKRGARFVSVVALARHGCETVCFRGEAPGRILDAARGNGGFGYDPLFFSSDLHMTFAEADGAAKNTVSHRGRALARFIAWLRENPAALNPA